MAAGDVGCCTPCVCMRVMVVMPEGVLMVMQNENKFKCPCHGSQYNAEGKVVRGPAPLVRLLHQLAMT